MFTGIITDVGEVLAVERRAQGLRHRLKLACAFDRASIADGASIACNGVCMTVVGSGAENGRTWFAVDAAAETLKITTVGQWHQGMRVNLERALRIGDELGGHIVAAHADGIARVTSREDLPDMARFVLRVPATLARFIAAKGSVALDGVSLTVNDVTADSFSVLIIPHTLAVTTIGTWGAGTDANLEVDLMARYAARLLEARA
jgi:riboflavin synthase